VFQQPLQLQTLRLRPLHLWERRATMSLISWLKSKSAAERLIVKALVDFEEGDQKDALGDLIAGLRGFASGTKADVVLANIQTRLANFNMIPILTPATATPATTATK
jgi:hypothetical protein